MLSMGNQKDFTAVLYNWVNSSTRVQLRMKKENSHCRKCKRNYSPSNKLHLFIGVIGVFLNDAQGFPVFILISETWKACKGLCSSIVANGSFLIHKISCSYGYE